MRRDLLIAAQKLFYFRYPDGFDTPELAAIRKKHRLVYMQALAHECFLPANFLDADRITEDILKITLRSSMVSVFEKMRLKDFVNALDLNGKGQMAEGLFQMLHGDFSRGFAIYQHILDRDRLGKWPLITVIPNYFNPNEAVFIKPTTVKNIIRVFELEGLDYSPRPSFSFYTAYRSALLEMKALIAPELAPDNAAFSGFLMMAMEMMNESGITKGEDYA